MCGICAGLRPWADRCDYAAIGEQAPQDPGAVMARRGLPTLTADEIADKMLLDYWEVDIPARWDTTTISYDVSDLPQEGRRLARLAFEEWSSVTGLRFRETSSRADIVFGDADDDEFAYATPISIGYDPETGGNIIEEVAISFPFAWLEYYSNEIDSDNFRVMLHEIGHALGLGHPGRYNGDGVNFDDDAEFANDSYQMTLMSYFDQEDAGISADYALPITPMLADIAALQRVYGAPRHNHSDTVYGARSTAGGAMDQLGEVFGSAASLAFTIYDSGGRDMIDVSPTTQRQRVDLREGMASDIDGLKGNLLIALGTVIEDAKTGSGNDTVRGNAADNLIRTRQGNDDVRAKAGDDSVYGGSGDDRITGGGGNDRLRGGSDDDRLSGNEGRDVLMGEAGRDLLSGGGGRDRLSGGDGDDRLSGGVKADVMDGGRGADRMDGGWGKDRMTGGSGDDRLEGADGADVLRGGEGDDVLLGGRGDDHLRGALGDDRLLGRAGDDRLEGGSGADSLFGGSGDDRITGGGGYDMFVFRKGSGVDRITDFDIDWREDIDLSGLTRVKDWADLRSNHLRQDGDDAVIVAGPDRLILEGIDASDLRHSDFVF